MKKLNLGYPYGSFVLCSTLKFDLSKLVNYNILHQLDYYGDCDECVWKSTLLNLVILQSPFERKKERKKREGEK